MKDLSQKIIKFDHEKNYKFDDFYVSKSNKHIIDILNISILFLTLIQLSMIPTLTKKFK